MELVKIVIGKSLFYYLYIIFCIALFLGLYFFLRKKSQKVQYWTLFGFLAFNFVLHFVKLAFPEYDYFPISVRKITFENICAVSTLIFPFIFLSKSKGFKDYMFYMGIVSGNLGCFVPWPVVGKDFYRLETIRYYLCHGGIWIVPLLMVVLGLHKLDYRRIWKTVLIYFGVLCIMMVNELILIRLGWVDTSTMDEFFDSSNRDMGYAVGPPAAMAGVAKYITWLTPKAWKDPYVPILWELFPVIILGSLGCFLVSMIWDHKHFKTDCIALKNKTVVIYGKLQVKFCAFKAKMKARKNGEEYVEPSAGADPPEDTPNGAAAEAAPVEGQTAVLTEDLDGGATVQTEVPEKPPAEAGKAPKKTVRKKK